MTAGTVNMEGRLRVRVRRAGGATTMADILRLVEAAQARTAPIQRLADSVAGRFALGVMAASTATLAFWALAGPTLFPQVLHPEQWQHTRLSLAFGVLHRTFECGISST